MVEQGVAGGDGRSGPTQPAAPADRPARPAAAPAPAPVLYRPRRIRRVVWVAAVVVTLAAVALALALPGAAGASSATSAPGAGVVSFGIVDRVAVVGLGLFGAAILLSFTRPLVAADADGVRVRNVFGDRRYPWQQVVAVRFDRGASWATLELPDGETVGVLAVQAVDKQRAVEAVRSLRALHHHAVS